MKIDGACHCGQVTYEAELDPNMVGICHCADCQALSASAFRTIAIVTAENFKVTKGAPKHYVKTGESGNRRVQAFCADCGSGLYATSADDPPAYYNIRIGTAKQRAKLPPVFECWRQSVLPWLPTIQATSKFDKNPELS